MRVSSQRAESESNIGRIGLLLVPADVHQSDETVLPAIHNRKCIRKQNIIEPLLVLRSSDILRSQDFSLPAPESPNLVRIT
jgi:hypothetical protein